MFKKSLIGAYCNRLYDFAERQFSFSRCGRIKANTAFKELNVTIVDTKGSPPNHQKGPSLIVQTTTIWGLSSILTMFYPFFLTVFKSMNNKFVTLFFLFECYLLWKYEACLRLFSAVQLISRYKWPCVRDF